MKYFVLLIFNFCSSFLFGQLTPFEKSGGKETATYYEAINYYQSLAKRAEGIKMFEMGTTDAGLPLHLVLLTSDKNFDLKNIQSTNKKTVILINNGIHPGEPDGIDASMMVARDMLNKKVNLPANVLIGIIPIYNIGGSLNRNSTTRVNQNGPLSFGFRGNAQNLDLNRDFTKNDSKNARSFATIFHFLDPHILIDTHVSDGADYQHTMTLISTQYDKLGGSIGGFLRDKFEPALYKNMAYKGWDMTPYVNFETQSPDSGMVQFYDPPRYSSGYAALFQTMSFMPETHMLKPFDQRVKSTYDLLITMIEEASKFSDQIISNRILSRKMITSAKSFPLNWREDSSTYSQISFKGYEQAHKISAATGLDRMYYDHSKPFTKQVKYFNHFKGTDIIVKPKAYVLPQGWWAVADILKLNGVNLNKITNDTSIEVTSYKILDYKSGLRAYEKHHRNTSVKLKATKKTVFFRKGDYLINMDQNTNRYVLEMLEPTGDDSFFAWNFFDAILQQKEGYSDYRWEDIAAEVLTQDPELKQKLESKRLTDPGFAKNSQAQLDFIYKNSVYYESAHMQYPVYRVE